MSNEIKLTESEKRLIILILGAIVRVEPKELDHLDRFDSSEAIDWNGFWKNFEELRNSLVEASGGGRFAGPTNEIFDRLCCGEFSDGRGWAIDAPLVFRGADQEDEIVTITLELDRTKSPSVIGIIGYYY